MDVENFKKVLSTALSDRYALCKRIIITTIYYNPELTEKYEKLKFISKSTTNQISRLSINISFEIDIPIVRIKKNGVAGEFAFKVDENVNLSKVNKNKSTFASQLTPAESIEIDRLIELISSIYREESRYQLR